MEAPDIGDLTPSVAPEEAARRAFADRVRSGRVPDGELHALLADLERAPAWGHKRRWRSGALLLVCVGRSSRACRAAFVAEGLPLLGSLLQESMAGLEGGAGIERQEAGMWTLACLACLRALPLGRATLWEHRASIGKPFDRLHRWCGREKSALAAELRAPTDVLCRRWRRQPRPAGQETAPEQKALRRRVVDIIAHGLMGLPCGTSPHSGAPTPMSPAPLPVPLAAAEVEAALFGRFGGATPEYRHHARMLRSNLELPGNAQLRARVLAGEVSAEELAAMSSNALAPKELQEQRRVSERKVLKESIVHELVPDWGNDETGRSPYNWSTAPPPMVSPRREAENDEQNEDAPGASAPAPRPVLPMEPPPTPFREAVAQRAEDHMEPPTPDVAATPAHDEEDEEETALIRWLSGPC